MQDVGSSGAVGAAGAEAAGRAAGRIGGTPRRNHLEDVMRDIRLGDDLDDFWRTLQTRHEHNVVSYSWTTGESALPHLHSDHDFRTNSRLRRSGRAQGALFNKC